MNNKKNLSIELARIIACLIVIGCHVYLSPVGIYRVFIAMCFADGVTIFWMITGFHFFSDKEYCTRIRGVFLKIALPTVIVSLVSFYLNDWLCGQGSLFQSIARPIDDYMLLLRSFITWQPLEGVGHLWYIYTYIIVVALFPFLKGGAEFLSKNKIMKTIFLIISSLTFLLNDLQNNQLLHVSGHTSGNLFSSIIFVLIGFLFYDNLKILNKGWYIFCSMIVFVIIMVLRTWLYSMGYSNVMGWYSFAGLFSGLCVLVFAFTVGNIISNERIKAVIRWLGARTFPIYILHIFVVNLLRSRGVAEHLEILFCGKMGGSLGALVYTLTMTLIVFVISLIIVIFICFMNHLIKTREIIKVINKRTVKDR